MTQHRSHHHDQHTHQGMPNIPSWLSVEDALGRILSMVHELEPQEKPILEAMGQVLAEDVIAPIDVPPLANTSMDGYALQHTDVAGADPSSPVPLKIIGHVAAGYVGDTTVQRGTTIRIMTGAPIPKGADAVVPFEETDELDRRLRGEKITGTIRVLKSVLEGENVRPAGQDVRAGSVVLPKATTLRPGEIGVLASLGLASAKVIRQPVIAILSTGDELVDPPGSLREGQIYNSNSFTLAASVKKYGGTARVLGIARDNLASLEAKVAEGLDADLILTSAGVSRGDYDIVKDVLMNKGEINFWTVRMRPAKPLAFGTLKRRDINGASTNVPHLGLPGNPVSTMVAFEQFARPAILKMLGKKDLTKPTVDAVLEEPIYNTDGRRVYARACVTQREGVYYARLTGHQGSGVLMSMVLANGLAVCPEDVAVKEAGEVVQVQMLDWLENQSSSAGTPQI